MTADIAFWDGIAASYAAKPVDDPAAFERKIAITRRHLRPDHTVLDVGCGTGSLALMLAPFAREVHGLDVSGEMIRFANRKKADAGVQNLTFHVGGWDDYDGFGPASLDGLLAYSLLHLVADRDAALAKVFDLLKPGGFFVSSTVCLGQSWIPYRPLLSVMHWLGKAPPVDILRRDQLVAEVERAGFVDLELPDVGAKPEITFLVARKPGGSRG